MKMRADAYKRTCPLFFFEKRDETHSSDALKIQRRGSMHKADTSEMEERTSASTVTCANHKSSKMGF